MLFFLIFTVYCIKMLSYTEIEGEHFSKHMATTGTQRYRYFFPILELFSDIDSPTHRVGESATLRLTDAGIFLLKIH